MSELWGDKDPEPPGLLWQMVDACDNVLCSCEGHFVPLCTCILMVVVISLWLMRIK